MSYDRSTPVIQIFVSACSRPAGALPCGREREPSCSACSGSRNPRRPCRSWCRRKGGCRNGCKHASPCRRIASKPGRWWRRYRGGQKCGCACVSPGRWTARRPFRRGCTQLRVCPSPRSAPPCSAQQSIHSIPLPIALPFPACVQPSACQAA